MGVLVAVNKYVLTSKVVLPAGSYTPSVSTGTAPTTEGVGSPANFGTGSYAQGAGEYGSGDGVTFEKGTTILADPAGALYTAIGASNLRAFVDGQDDVGHAALSN